MPTANATPKNATVFATIHATAPNDIPSCARAAESGKQVTAIVVRRDGAIVDGAALTDFAGARLAGFKKPRRIEFVASLPRNAYNKVQTHLLKQEFGAS